LQPKKTNSPTLNQPTLGSNDSNTDTRLTSAEQKEWNSVLAGVLVDSFNQKISPAYIQVEALGAQNQGKPLDVAVDSNGYFMIPGLQPGQSYLLTARAHVDGRAMAGRVQAVPPQPRLMIKLRDDLVSNTLPPLPDNSGIVPASAMPNRPPLPPLGSNADPVNIPSPRVPANAPDTENIANGNSRPPVPLISVPGPGSQARPPRLPEPDPIPGNGASRFPGPAVAPACSISGIRVVNLSMRDLRGEVWDLRSQPRKLVLLDFWGTWCTHCLRAMPELNRLQQQFGSQGLEVVGIACEYSNDQETMQKVREVVRQKNIQYEIVLADPVGRCQVQNAFRVSKYPTLILLDENGNIVWRGEGAQIEAVRSVIQQRLR
jgi:thiol-disulfide isomerase/thioredoxin